MPYIMGYVENNTESNLTFNRKKEKNRTNLTMKDIDPNRPAMCTLCIKNTRKRELISESAPIDQINIY